ncbi:DNA binding protein URE-B1 [Arthroderma uncinatum]|uniref:DNA binding protein URE-B1 n=1 Tax=Arthroderma uncinatum TaxID=74035 RepID=UPI00144A5C75|nr:DNA binding protein URE-B1 [Arthroderma uncinatum]KAF3481342.1 DNA binding protein URE-B1 [Arthroderma uncinatum]
MGRIEKVASSKHEATISPAVAQFSKKAIEIPVAELPSYLATFPRQWPFPRGDLYHWIGALNRFDELLARVVTKYGLDEGPQLMPFGRHVLVEDSVSTRLASTEQECEQKLDQLGLGPEGDRELVESILDFSRLLLEKCGNRSLFSSSERLNAFLNTTSLSLIQCTLRLSLCLAQRYYFRQRSTSSTHFHQSLLATHYNIELERVQKLAAPFPRPVNFIETTEGTSLEKGKEVVGRTSATPGDKCNANDLISLTKVPSDKISMTDISPAAEIGTAEWKDWGNIRFSYYPRDAAAEPSSSTFNVSQVLMTPTPSRSRPPEYQSSRLHHGSSVDDSPTPMTQSPAARQEAARGMRVLDIPSSKVLSTSTEELLKENLSELPKDSTYDLLNRLRIAAALAISPETRRQLLGIRLLALTNLAYIYPEAIFQQKILQQDSDEPKRLQLAYQLSEFVHLGVAGDISASTLNQSFALICLDALAKHKARSADVCAALNLNVNHGILMFLVRKTVNELASEDDSGDDTDGDDWRDALFGLLRTLPSSGARAPETLVSAGLIPMFVDMLNLRTEKARRVYPRVLEFLDNFVHSVRDALATLATAKGFDAISGLIAAETKSAFEMVGEGKGISEEYKTPSTDYSIPYFQQQAIRWLFKFVNHVMQHNSGGFERLIRNLIDSPPLLNALRLVIENAKTFGSHVWSGSINIMSHFIHNEPTSYAVIAEAGLSKSFLEAVMCQPLEVPDESTEENKQPPKPQNLFNPAAASTDNQRLLDHLSKAPERKGSDGILASTEAIVGIPLAFGAICLNSTGLELFQSSDALERFFDIFESPAHVKCMKSDSNLLRLLGNSFDELVRHHPALKASVMSSVLRMVARVGLLGKYKAWECGLGAKLWVEDQDGKESISGGSSTAIGDLCADFSASEDHWPNSSVPSLGNSSTTYRELFGEPDVSKWTTKDVDEHGLAVSGYIFPVLKFLGAFFENQTICANFIENGGVEYVLDFAVLQSLPFSFHSNEANHQLSQVVHLMAETKPHLVLPPLLSRTLAALDKLEPFWSEGPGATGFFSALTSASPETASSPEALAVRSKGTYYVKHLVAVGTLTHILREVYTPPIYPTRPTQQPLPFHQVNLSDEYALVAERLGRLHAACVWEEILLQKDMPESWNELTTLPGFTGLDMVSDGQETPPVNTIDGGVSEIGDAAVESQAGDIPSAPQGGRSRRHAKLDNPTSTQLDKGAAVKNVKTLRWLLGSLPTCITGFLHALGRGLVGKRRVDTYQRQKAAMVAGAIASMVIQQLELKGPNECAVTKDRFSYLIVILSSFSRLLFDSTERAHSHCLTMILVAFKKQNGIQKMKELADIFFQEVKALAPLAQTSPPSPDRPARLASAYGGIKIILTFFSEMTSARYILDSAQTLAMASNDRDRERADFFLPQQFLVELRMEALPLVKGMWTSDFVETASSSIVKSLIEILRLVLEAEHETNAYRRGDNIPNPPSGTPRVFSIQRDRLAYLVEKGHDESLAREALYRCHNSSTAAEEYCNAQKGVRVPPRNPIPKCDAEAAAAKPSTTSRGDQLFGSFVGSEAGQGSSVRPDAQRLGDPIASILAEIHAEATEAMETQGGDASEVSPTLGADIARPQGPTKSPGSEDQAGEATPTAPPKKREVVTVDDLDKERDNLRSNLIERCLEVLNAHHDVTFDLADLISSASKVDNPFNFRREIGETLLHFLASLQMDESFLSGGKKIAAHASLLALLLQDPQFYESTLEPLQDNFYVLLGFVKVPPATSDKPTEESCPWIGQILLILERILAEDASPRAIQWNPPNADTPEDSDIAELGEPIVPLEGKTQLFEALLDVLPRIGKDESLALSVARVLVMLTRERALAMRLGERRNLQRLFVMIKQLSNPSNEKLQNSFMLIIRHIVEDEETIRQIIRNDIISSFDSRPSRQTDTTNFVRQYSHLVIRAPQLFVEVTNELLKLARYDSNQRPQTLVLKNLKKNDEPQVSEEGNKSDETKPEGAQSPPSAKEPDHQEPKESKEKHKELKTPIVEHPDGVVHYLLSELLSYRDVDDKELPPAPPAPPVEKPANKPEDVEMTAGEDSSTPQTNVNRDAPSKKAEKPQFKAEEHPIYVYRCFLLHCLTELLSSYNRTKVEFINFSRKADPLAMTPSKPRSGILNYLLHCLIPIGTMEHDESIAFKKRGNTSSWAMKVIIALCTKTIEYGGRRSVPGQEDEIEFDLLFVRRFVLEHALKSYKDASASREPLDSKYARLMCLADLFDKMLSGGASPDGSPRSSSATRQIAKTMFEKNFINAFTASVADIDLNFPSSKRVVKYILRPLNKLSQTAVLLSESGSIEAKPSQSDTDEISSASSVSEFSSSREETPDLFRHSTLGMFEPHEEETSSEEDEEDEEMYDDEFDEEMEYEEEMPENDGEVVSDEDEEDMDGRGPMEGLPGDAPMDIEVLIDGDSEDDDDEDDDEEDDEDDDEDEDDEGSSHLDERIVAGEITGDNDNNSLQDGEDEWESEEGSEEADDELAMMNQLEIELGGGMAQGEHNRPGQPHLENLLRVLEETGASVERLDREMDHGMRDLGEDFIEDDLNEEEDEDEEVDELEDEVDEFDEDQGMYHEYDNDDGDLSNSPWSWDEPVSAQNRIPSRNIPSWNFFPGQMASRQGIIPVPDYRSHRTQIAPPRNDDGVNPLLRRNDRAHEQPAQRRGPNAEAFSDWVTAMDPNSHGRLLSIDSPVTFMNAIMQAIGQGGPDFGIVSRPDGFHLHLDRGSVLPGRLQDLFGLGRAPVVAPRSRDDPAQAVAFPTGSTLNRWQEEARLHFNNLYMEKAQRVVQSILKLLVPPAIEEDKQRQKKLEEERKRLEEEKIEREKQERIAREEAEKEKKRKEEEEEAARKLEEERRAEENAEASHAEPMEDVQPTDATGETTQPAEASEAGPSEPAQRVHTTIRGRQLDITGMEIDPEYLEALPEEMREEVILQQLAEQRSQAAVAGEEPSEINPEFLEALPAEIREELLQQEAADRRRRERESARRQAAANGAPHAEDMDPASFIATLEPSLRQTVLADQPDDILASLGPEFVTEARALTGGRRLPRFGDPGVLDAHPGAGSSRQDQETKKPQRRQIVQVVDKAGVATLLRLMFMPLQGNARHHLNDILHNVCQNRQNRSEVISLLLLILQDGSADISAVERSFAHLSLRAKTPTSQRTPQPLKRTLSLPVPGANHDVTPLIVIQQCLGALSFLTQYNPHIPWFFLTEHEAVSALKMKALRKGKTKENRANKFALNSLLSLLDRKAILDSPNCMEQLSGLLSSITHPLTILLRKDADKQDDSENKVAEAKLENESGQGANEPQPQATGYASANHPTTQSDTTMADSTALASDSAAHQEQKEGDDGAGEKAARDDRKQKKTRTIDPPVVPEYNLRLVVHILSARECNGRTFRETLSTINNLSSIPGAKEIIGKELVGQAQTLSKSILVDLDELIPHITNAETGTDVQGMALAKFSPASSDQAKLLRVLTALDYLFDPSRGDKEKMSEAEASEKANTLKVLYESVTFGPLWTKLSDCLHAVQRKETMLNVATTLLPLIESLMVVCKNTTLKDVPLFPKQVRDFAVSSPPPDSGMEGLFFNFTEDHRKILNELVRQNPRLMSGTFSLLVKNPKVLEFDNKRNYFNRRIHSRGTEARHPHPPLQLSVRRDQVFLDSFKSLYFKTADEMKYGKLSIRFHGEEGVDAGGVSREWFQVLARGMFNPDYALFIPVASDRTTFHPNRLSGVNQEHLMFFKFIGRIIGKALYEGRVLDCHFSRAVYKRILGKSVSIKDMETLDLDYYKSLLWMLENDITDILTENFSVEVEDFGETRVIDLVENGRNIPVTEENKEEYVQHVVEHRLTELDLPEYESYEALRKCLYTAMTAGSEYFGFA